MKPTRIIPLGGVEEIGKSTLLIEHENHIFIIDAGIKFADTFNTGVKGIIPSYEYLNQPDKVIEGLFITHGHEDHIGGVVYLVKQTKLKKIFGPRIAIQYLKAKFEEHRITKKIEFIEIEKTAIHKFANDCVVDFWTAQHSIPDAFGIRVTTPNGSLMFTGDFRFDYTPIGNYTDFARLDQIGKEGLTALLSDSTNAMRPDHSPSESDILTDIEKHMRNAKRKIIVTSFASNLTRVKVIIELAAKMNKKVITFGRSMIQGIKIGRKLGYINVGNDVLIDKKQLASVKETDLVILTTGSQGEQLAALSRMSYGKHATIKIAKGDVVIFSSSPIPGNRMVVELLINRLYKLGALIKENGPDGYLHTSGHAYKWEHDKIFQLTKPKYFLPYHGEYRMSIVHGQTAIDNGVRPENVLVIRKGEVYNMLNNEIFKTDEKVDFGPIYIDGNTILSLSNEILKERARLKDSGFVNIVFVIDRQKNLIMGRPQIITRGSFFVKTSKKLIEETKRVAHGAVLYHIKNFKDWNTTDLEKIIVDRLSALFYKEKRRDPIVVPTIIYTDEPNEELFKDAKVQFTNNKNIVEENDDQEDLKSEVSSTKPKVFEKQKSVKSSSKFTKKQIKDLEILRKSIFGDVENDEFDIDEEDEI
ncbi:ribonuclease J [Mycoplasmopsis gallopavonis]|uniref:Metallo-beta-lactamase superfamily protein n=1 Tax=Mycoplasmopsis gallopavonis TaxID=76629 RepID=A0A449B015_9BACT|nr:ribonuclease J [Mycoplasmopsis gallopavonis]RIV16544.1 ribonuclease J [Mycoplasmopsis gallopavonis]VEU73082.1 metallo-beta-lactamase superfamily protein [Mycoplasmopsis gallopavonis]